MSAPKKPVTAIVVIEGGALQSVYCPDPSIDLVHILIDYDNDQCGLDGLLELSRQLREADREERLYREHSTVSGELAERLGLLPDHALEDLLHGGAS